MLDELIVDVQGTRYIGHVWAGMGDSLVHDPPMRWCFSHQGRAIAEFPATPLDTPESVGGRLRAAVTRVEKLIASRRAGR